MRITQTDIYRLSIPMHPFTIATGTMHTAQNIFIRLHCGDGVYGVGECSAFPMIVGENQDTCFALAKLFASAWKGKDPADIPGRMAELHAAIAFNHTVKSAFDMALYDLAARLAGQPLYRFLGAAAKKTLETDITVGIGYPPEMAAQAAAFKEKGFRIIKVKLGRDPAEDVERIRLIREAVGPDHRIRIDANQGWDYDSARYALSALGKFDIEFCEQPMRYWDDHKLPALRQLSPVKIMADESVFDHHDAVRLLDAGACDYVNIKFSKSGGILGALKIDEVCAARGIACMMGGMLESRLALSAFAHFALARPNVLFNDMDTCLLGHKEDPVIGGVSYRGCLVEVPDAPGIGADIAGEYLAGMEMISV